MTQKLYDFETGAITDVGRVRDHNEDNLMSEPERGIWVVADGMGGHHGGDFASACIVGHAASIGVPTSAPDLQARFIDRITKANAEIQQRSAEQDGVTIGATVVGLLTYEHHFACLWSGDSRIYLIRGGELHQVTRDHTEVQALLDSGAITEEEAETWPRKNVITRAIGVHPEAYLDHQFGVLQNADRFVLCSDGLTGHVTDPEILQLGSTNPPQEACQSLIDLTLERGATDNVTVIVVQCKSRETTLSWI